MKQRNQQVLSVVLSLALCQGSIPAAAFANEEEPTSGGEVAAQGADGASDAGAVPADGAAPDAGAGLVDGAAPDAGAHSADGAGSADNPADGVAAGADAAGAADPASAAPDGADPDTGADAAAPAPIDPVSTDVVLAPQDAVVEQAAPAAAGAGQSVVVYDGTVAVAPELVIPDADALPDNDELFAGYVESALYASPGIAPLSLDFYLDALSVEQRAIYEYLLTFAQNIADGTSISTSKIAITTPMKSVPETIELTPEQVAAFGTIQTVDGAYVLSETQNNLAVTIVSNATYGTNDSIKNVVNCLLANRPYEFYWYDKTSGYVYYGPEYSISFAGMPTESGLTPDSITLYLTSRPRVTFSVASSYWSGATETAAGVSQPIQINTDSAKTSAASEVRAAAEQIVEDNAELSDDEKLAAYRDAICELVSYNSAAASESYAGGYGDPWQLIYVFDGDSGTNVVCEGYAKAFQYLCDLTVWKDDISCYTVTGTMTTGGKAERHMWNIVERNGVNYLVDVTNSDAGTVGASGGLFMAEPNETPGVYASTYTFSAGSSTVTYAYDEDAIALFGETYLTLGAPEPTSLNDAKVTLTAGNSFVYNGTAQEPAVSVAVDGTPLPTSAYTVSYENNVNASTADKPAQVTVSAVAGSGYTGSVTTDFVIAPCTLGVTAAAEGPVTKVYDGTTAGPDGFALAVTGAVEGDDVRATYQTAAYNSADVAEADTLTVGGIALAGDDAGNYTLAGTSLTCSATITPRELTGLNVSVTAASPIVYDGTEKTPAVAVYDGATLLACSLYTVNYENNVDAGIAQVKVSGATGGNYAFEAGTTFDIAKADQEAPTIIGLAGDVITYHSSIVFSLESDATMYGDATWRIIKGSAATIDPQTGTLTATGVGEITVGATLAGDKNHNSVEAKPLTTTIMASSTSIASATLAPKTYDGTTAGTVESVTFSHLAEGDQLVLGTDFTATAVYDDANAGTDKTATVTVTLLDTPAANLYKVTTPYTLTGQTIAKGVLPTEQIPTAASSARCGASGSFDLASLDGLLPAGWTLAGIAGIDDPSAIFAVDGEGNAAVSTAGSVLTYQLKGDASLVGASATVRLTVSCTNYGDFELPVTVTVADRDVPTLSVAPIERTYDGTPVLDGDIVGTATFEGATVAGTWAFAADQALTDVADSGAKTVVFTPADAQFKTVETTVQVTIDPVEVPAAEVTVNLVAADGSTWNGSVTYNGQAWEPQVQASWTPKTRTANAFDADDLQVTYENNRNVGTARVLIAGRDGANFKLTGSLDAVEFTILPATVTPVVSKTITKTYDGTTDAPEGFALAVTGAVEGDDVRATYQTAAYNSADVAEADTLTVGGIALAGDDAANYVLSKSTAVFLATITARVLTKDACSLAYLSTTYDGTDKTPAVTVVDNGKTLVKDVDFAVDYTNNRNAGTATVRVRKADGGPGLNYSINVELTFTIAKADQAPLTIEVPGEGGLNYGDTVNLVAKGGSSGETVQWNLVYGLATLGADGALTANGIAPIAVTATMPGGANYNDVSSAPRSIDVSPAPLTVTGAVLGEKAYDGTATGAVESVTLDGLVGSDQLVLGTDFTAVAVYGDTNAGTDKAATVTVTLGTTNLARRYVLAQPAVDLTGQTIAKADRADEALPGKQGGLNGTVSVDLASYLPAGGVLGEPVLADEAGIAADEPQLAGTVLTLALTGDYALAGQTAIVSVPVVSSTNYNAYNLVVGVELVDDRLQPVLDPQPITVTYSGAPVSDEEIHGTATVLVDPALGTRQEIAGTWSFVEGQALTDVADSGVKQVRFTPDEDGLYLGAEAGVQVTIEPQVTVGEIVVTVVVPEEGLSYTGAPLQPKVLVTCGGVEIPASSYTVEFTNNVAAGEASVVVKSVPGANIVIGNATSSAGTTFTIEQAQLEAPAADEPVEVPQDARTLADVEAAVAEQFGMPGTVVWDGVENPAETPFEEGVEYGYTFVPADRNYAPVEGSLSLERAEAEQPGEPGEGGQPGGSGQQPGDSGSNAGQGQQPGQKPADNGPQITKTADETPGPAPLAAAGAALALAGAALVMRRRDDLFEATER